MNRDQSGYSSIRTDRSSRKPLVDTVSIKGISLRKIGFLIGFRGMGVLLQMLMQFAIARVAGPSGVGVMQLYQTWSCVLGEISAAGLPTQTMKSISVSQHRAQVIDRLTGSLKIIVRFWSVAALILLLISLASENAGTDWLTGWLPFSGGSQIALMWSVLCFAILRLSAEALKAMNCAGEAVFAENSLLPVCMLLYCLCVAYGVFSVDSSVDAVHTSSDILIYVATVFLSIAAAYSLTRSHIQASAMGSDELVIETKKHNLEESESGYVQKPEPLFTSETRYFWGSSVINIGFLSMPFLLMPYFGDLIAIGLFTLAFKLINPITTILGMLNALFGPGFAKAAPAPFHSDNRDARTLSKLLVQSQLLSVALYLPLLIPVLLFSESILGLFGDEFIQAKPYLYILAIAQLFNAATGLSGNMLNMVGMGHREFQGAILFFILGLTGGIVCGQIYGLTGIAITYAMAFAGKNIWSYSFATAYILNQSEAKQAQACSLA